MVMQWTIIGICGGNSNNDENDSDSGCGCGCNRSVSNQKNTTNQVWGRRYMMRR